MSNILTNGFLKWVLQPRTIALTIVGIAWVVGISMILMYITGNAGVVLTDGVLWLTLLWFAGGMIVILGLQPIVNRLTRI